MAAGGALGVWLVIFILMHNALLGLVIGPVLAVVASLISPILLDGAVWTNWEMRAVRATALD